MALAAADKPLLHIRNFGEVNETLYRGAEPSPVAMQELSARGIKLVIDLRESGQATVREKQEAAQLGMQYVNEPLPPFSAPRPEQLRTVLFLLLNHGSTPVFVHCRRGKDRTGTVVACYRVQHDGWDNGRALTEASDYGMSRAEWGMRSFVLHFSPLMPSSLLSPPSLHAPAVQP